MSVYLYLGIIRRRRTEYPLDNSSGDCRDARALIGRELRHISLYLGDYSAIFTSPSANNC